MQRFPRVTPANVSLVLFAGGRATRLGGVNKALLPVGGMPIVERILGELRPLIREAVILTNDESLAILGGVRLIPDALAHAGVLPALADGLERAHGTLCLAVACDMPFASGAVFEHLLRLQEQEDADVVIPRTGQHLEPMHAVYRRAPVLSAIRAALARGENRMTSYLRDVRVREVLAAELEALGPGDRAFFNVNTPADLAEAQRLARAVC